MRLGSNSKWCLLHVDRSDLETFLKKMFNKFFYIYLGKANKVYKFTF